MIQKFFNALMIDGHQIQTGEVNRLYEYTPTFLEENKNKNLYFLGGLPLGLKTRASDADVEVKNYVMFDYDIKKQHVDLYPGEELNEDSWLGIFETLRACLDGDPYFSKYSFVTYTGGGLHIGYLFTPIFVKGKAEAWSRGYELMTKKLDELMKPYTADIACRNIGRIFRIPTSYNQKFTPPIQTKFLAFKPTLCSVGTDILKRGESVEVKPVAVNTTPLVTKPGQVAGLSFFELLGRLDNRMMLTKLSGSSLVGGEIFSFRRRPTGGEYIDVNGKPADCWLDPAGYIGSGKKAGPTWIQWLGKYYGCTWRAIEEWAKANMKEFLPDGKATTRNTSAELEEEAMSLLNAPASDLTWGVNLLDTSFGPIFPGDYIVIVGESGAGKTAFTYQMAVENAKAGISVLYLSLEMTGGQIVARRAGDAAGFTKDEWRTKKISESKRALFAEGIKVPELLTIETRKLGREPTVNDIENFLKEGKYKMIIVDNFGYLSGTEKTEWDQLRVISRKFTALCEVYGVVIVALHHLNKGQSKRSAPRGPSAVRGSGKIENDVWWLVEFWRETNPEVTSKLSAEERKQIRALCYKSRRFGESVSEELKYERGTFKPQYPFYF